MALNETLNQILSNGTDMHTSGTTGTSKLIYQSIDKIQAANSVARNVQNINSNSRILTVCTLDHVGGLFAQTLPGHEVGAHIHTELFNAYSWVRQISDYTHSHLTPNMARAVMKTRSFTELNLAGITVMVGSDRVHTSIINNFLDQNATFITNWGMTEVGPVAINQTFQPGDRAQATETIMGNRTFCDTTIRDGELLVRGDISVYDDWFATGDLVDFKQGIYYYMGRILKKNKVYK